MVEQAIEDSQFMFEDDEVDDLKKKLLNAEENERLKPNKFSLRFNHRLLEWQYQELSYITHARLIRFILPVLLVMYLGASLFDDLLYKETVQDDLRVLQYGVQAPILVIWISLSFRKVWYPLNFQFVTAVGTFALGIANVAQSVVGREPDHGPHMLYFFIVYMFLRLRFVFAAAVCWVLMASFILAVGIWVPAYDRLVLASGYMALSNACLMFASYVLEYYYRLDFFRQHILLAEKQRSFNLLQSLLPESVTEQLKAGKKNIAEVYESVTILFSDLVGFTAFCSRIEARLVVNFLNTLYTAFDKLTVCHSVHKVETIGDAYFVAAGKEY